MQELTETGEIGCQLIQYVIDTAPLFNSNKNTNNKMISGEGNEKEKKNVFVVCVFHIFNLPKKKSLDGL